MAMVEISCDAPSNCLFLLFFTVSGGAADVPAFVFTKKDCHTHMRSHGHNLDLRLFCAQNEKKRASSVYEPVLGTTI